MGGKHPHDFKVEFWTRNGSVERTMAICDNVIVAGAAFEASCAEYPRERITLRQGARVLREQFGARLQMTDLVEEIYQQRSEHERVLREHLDAQTIYRAAIEGTRLPPPIRNYRVVSMHPHDDGHGGTAKLERLKD